MPKVSQSFDLTLYAPVADRITLFYKAYPNGRIITCLVRRTQHEVLFRAEVYRDSEAPQPAATGWAAEREGDGDVNLVACLENAETSAIGRALANLGFTASARRPSQEEMDKAARERARRPLPSRPQSQARAPQRSVARPESSSLQTRANAASDVLRLLTRAERLGVRSARIERWRRVVLAGSLNQRLLEHYERRLRAWLSREATTQMSRAGIISAEGE
jgi:hypothetical protein